MAVSSLTQSSASLEESLSVEEGLRHSLWNGLCYYTRVLCMCEGRGMCACPVCVAATGQPWLSLFVLRQGLYLAWSSANRLTSERQGLPAC